GLATPTAIMVGIGKAAKRGILIKGGSVLENFAKSKQIIFDKTGTLSTGKFVFTDFEFKGDEAELKQIIYSIESHSSHPIAKALVEQYPNWNQQAISFNEIKEMKGKGMEATDASGDIWRLGSAKWLGILDNDKDLFLVQNEKLMAAWNIADEIKEDAHELIAYLNKQGIETILLSGDKQKKVNQLANELGMETALGERLPEEKLAYISKQVEKNPELVMVGDGVNDAPALSKVAVGVSFVKGSDMAIEAANVVLMHNGLKSFQEAHIISKLTYKTIKQNLFWAFFYNILCIPLAAAGFMHPMLGALSMAFSDVIVIGNSLLLGLKKIKADK
ncbi:MAG: HAD-IC family P-type ATPase, partial [Bacteroidia bacterium]|nr:HAD-IC family P-type ATPase [Bacteroidia bacterium]